MKRKKGIALLTLFVLILTCLSGCGSKAGGKTELVVWWWGEGDTPGSKQWLEETAQSYMKEHKDITIKLVEQTNDQLYPAWESAVQAGKGADIQFLWTGVWALDSVWNNSLASMTELIPEEELKHWTSTEGLSYDNQLWLSPWYQISIVWMYNKDLFRAAGLDPDNPPSDWDSLLTACEALKKSGVIPLELGGMKDGWGAAWLYSVFGPAAHDSFREYIEAATIPGEFTSDKHTQWLERLQQLYDSGYVNELTMSYDFFQGRETFLRGESAMGLATNGQAVQWMEQMGGEDKVGIMKIPVMGEGSLAGGINTQSHSFSIPEFSNHKKEAADFLIYMHQPNQLKSFYEITKNIPCDDRFDPAWLGTESEKELCDYINSEGIPYAEIFIPAMVDSEGMYAATQMIFSGQSAKEAAEYMEQVAEKWRGMDSRGVENFKSWAKSYKD